MFHWYKRRKKDTIKLVKEKSNDLYQVVGETFADSDKNEIQYKDKVLALPKAGIFNEHDNWTYFIDVENNEFIDMTKGKNDVDISPQTLDKITKKNFIHDIIEYFGGSIQPDKTLIIFSLLAGIGGGYILKSLMEMFM